MDKRNNLLRYFSIIITTPILRVDCRWISSRWYLINKNLYLSSFKNFESYSNFTLYSVSFNNLLFRLKNLFNFFNSPIKWLFIDLYINIMQSKFLVIFQICRFALKIINAPSFNDTKWKIILIKMLLYI